MHLLKKHRTNLLLGGNSKATWGGCYEHEQIHTVNMWIHKILPSYIMSFTLSGKTWWDNDIHKKERRQQGRNAKARHDISTFFLQYWDASSLSFLNCHLLSCLESSLESNDKKLYFSCIYDVSGASYFDWIFTLLLRQIFTFFDQSMPQFFT